jgi:hypothetical protein
MTFDAVKFEQERDRIYHQSCSVHLAIWQKPSTIPTGWCLDECQSGFNLESFDFLYISSIQIL